MWCWSTLSCVHRWNSHFWLVLKTKHIPLHPGCNIWNQCSLVPAPSRISFIHIDTDTESESLYDWLFTASQFVLAPTLLRLATRDFVFCKWTLAIKVLIHPLWRENRLRVCQVYVLHIHMYMYIYSMLLKILPCALYKISLSVQTLQSRCCLSYISYVTTAA
jgi:hypothetical protein